MKDIKVIYQGFDIYPDISINSCMHYMFSEKRSDYFILKMNDTRYLWDSWNPKPDDIISIEDGSAKTGKMYVESITPENGLISLRAFSVPQSSRNKTNKSWEKVKFTQLAQEIAGRQGLGFEQHGIEDKLYEYLAQQDTEDFSFLQKHCLLEGASFLVYDGKLVLYNQSYLEKQSAIDTINVTSDRDFTYYNNAINMYKSAEVTNGKHNGKYIASHDGSKDYKTILKIYMDSDSEAEHYAKGILRDLNNDMVTGSIWTPITKQYAASSVANIKTTGKQSWDSNVFITQIRHDYVNDKSKIFFRKPLEGY